jgi:parvulin-like peptidyl-prolyl isomerase
MTTTKQSRTRRIVIEVGIAILLAVVARVIWNQVYIPSRPVAQVGTQTIDRRAYQRLSELDLAQQFVFVQQAINRQQQTGAQPNLMPSSPFAQDPQETLQLRDTIAAELRNTKSRADTGLIDHWIDQEVILQGAAKEGVAVSDQEINAALIRSFTSPDGGHAHEEEALEDETATAQSEAAPEQTALAVDAPTLLADSYNELVRVLQAEYGLNVGFSQAEFAAHVLRQQRVELLNERLEEKLLPASQTPKSLQVHAYFLLLPVQSSATSTEVVTSSAEFDDAAFAEAKIKADELYRQLKQGADFVTLANQYTPSPEETVDPGWSVPDALWPSLREAVLNQPLGEVGQPVKTPSGWYIAKVLERAERPDRQKLEEERGKLLQAWNEQQRQALGVKQF